MCGAAPGVTSDTIPWFASHVSCLDLTYYLVYSLAIMIKVNIHEAKTHLSHYLDEVQKGEKILLCKRNQPIAEIRPIAPASKSRRPIGLAKTVFQVPDTFFEELPEETVALFNGEDA
jgi:prevent-host-death family protein